MRKEGFHSMLLERSLPIPEARMKNPLALAFLGDTVWELCTRERLLKSGMQAGALHRHAIAVVNAGAQSQAAGRIEPHLTEAEADVFRRGMNAHSRHNAPKNQDPYDYSRATGLEALLGYLYLIGEDERIRELFDIGVGIS